MASSTFDSCKENFDLIQLFDTHLKIKTPKNKSFRKYYYIWLRDHCRCLHCYNEKTRQISLNILDIPINIKPASCELTADSLKIIWQDKHNTEFPLQWLEDLQFPVESKREVILWNKNTVSTIEDTKISAELYLKQDNSGVKQLLNSLLKYGFGFVTGVDTTIEATEVIARGIAPVQKTVFGEMWNVTNDYYHEDTAYTNIALSAHTDNTYFNEPAGLQIFHMLSHDGTGGETLLVDGFNVATNLKNNKKDLFDILCSSPLQAEYIEEECHFSTVDSVIKLHPVTKDLFQIRYNIYDRAILNTIPTEKILKFYEAYREFGRGLRNPNNELWLKLEPKTVLFIDNWRVLHGRAAYTGARDLCGCYISRPEWLSKAKVIGLNIF